MTVANTCQTCGTETPLEGATTDTYVTYSNGMMYHHEDIYCGTCGSQVGGSSYPEP